MGGGAPPPMATVVARPLMAARSCMKLLIGWPLRMALVTVCSRSWSPASVTERISDTCVQAARMWSIAAWCG